MTDLASRSKWFLLPLIRRVYLRTICLNCEYAASMHASVSNFPRHREDDPLRYRLLPTYLPSIRQRYHRQG